MSPSSTIIESKLAITKFVDEIQDTLNVPEGDPPLYLHLEMQRHFRHSTIFTLIIFVHPKKHIFVVDVRTLQADAFNTTGHKGQTLRDILESEPIPKVFFDVRNAATALYAHCDIRLRGVQDVQLMQNASRQWATFKELHQCIRRDARITTQEKTDWMAVHFGGPAALSPSHGDSYEIPAAKPLSAGTLKYCINEVLHLPELRRIYLRRLVRGSKNMLPEVTDKRVLQSLSEVDHSRHLATVLKRNILSDFSWILPQEFGERLLR